MPGTETDPFYQAVVEGFRALGAKNPQAIRRAVLIRDLLFAGQQFQCEGMKAVWHAGAKSVDFFDGQGQLLQTFHVDQRPMNRVA